MADIATWTTLYAAAVVFGAFVVRGMSGFGTSLVAIPLLIFVMPIHAAVPMMTVLGLCVTLMLGVRDRGHVRWDEFWRLLGPTLLGVFAGVYLFASLDARFMQKLLGAFIVAYSLYMVAAQFVRGSEQRCSTRWGYPAGFASSAIDSVFGGGGGPLVVMYMHRRGYDPIAFRATLAVLWLLELVVRVGGYALGGYYDRGVLLLALLFVPVMLLGNRIGEVIGQTISQQSFSRVIAAVLLASGGSLLLK
ncbi:MAG: sulfite exporter TauE/SafE family protein [Betaproteobacteria bacterium]|nr:MAG: sulfite exporter TauE/SafE family protein [Betaproteobacteria bacterium]